MNFVHAKFQLTRKNFSLDVDLHIPQSGITALFGPSGSGKSTTLRCIAGLEKCDRSYLKVDAELWQNDMIFLPSHLRPIGFVFQEPNLFAHLTVLGNINFGAKRVKASNNQHIQNLIQTLNIEHILNQKPSSLSGGEAQRVGLACALAVKPRLLLLDEPLSALDFKLKAEIIPYIEKLSQNTDIPIIYVSHSLDEILRLATHIILVEGGRQIATGPVTEVLTRLNLPIAQGLDAVSLIDATVIEHDLEFKLTRLKVEMETLFIMEKHGAPGSKIRVSIFAKDVSISLSRPTDSSVLNVLEVIIKDMTNETNGHVLLQLLLGNTALLARISQKSCVTLQLHPGKSVFAQIKSVACLYSNSKMGSNFG